MLAAAHTRYIYATHTSFPVNMASGWEDSRFIDLGDVDDDMRCAICSSVCRDAMQCGELHQFCSKCIHTWLENNNTCPLGDEALDAKKDLMPAHVVRRAVATYEVRCTFKDFGCEAVATIEDIEVHEGACDFRQVPCKNRDTGCPEILCQRDIDTHEAACDFARINCRRCGCALLRKSYNQHYDGLLCIKVLADTVQSQQQEIQRLRDTMQQQTNAMQGLFLDLDTVADLRHSARAAGAVLKVVGSGTPECNGFYKDNGLFQGKPQYCKIDLSGSQPELECNLWCHVDDGGVCWGISSDQVHDGGRLYSHTGPADTPPPTSGWEIRGGAAPAPVIHYL